MKIRSAANGGTAEVTDDLAERLIATGSWEAADAPVKPKRTRRTRAQIEADKAAEAAQTEE